MGALSHYLEAEGIATTQVSLVREHTAAIAAPRALWVSFPLGRPLGVPDDAAFQRRVLLGALQLLERDRGPVLEDFPEDAPRGEDDAEAPVACPVSFARPRSGTLAEQMQQEMADLAPWYAIALAQRQRSTVGLSGLDPQAAAAFVCDVLDGRATRPYRDELTLGLALRLACEDVKAYYFEACGAQPGNGSHEALFRWFWTQTVAGKLYAKLRETCRQHEDRSVRLFANRNLVPRAAESLIGKT